MLILEDEVFCEMASCDFRRVSQAITFDDSYYSSTLSLHKIINLEDRVSYGFHWTTNKELGAQNPQIKEILGRFATNYDKLEELCIDFKPANPIVDDEEDDYYGDVEPISKEEFMKGIAKRAIDMLP